MRKAQDFNVIEGGKSEVLASYEDLFHGEKDLSVPHMNKLLDIVGEIEQHDVSVNFAEKVFWPFNCLTAFVWRINELSSKNFDFNSNEYLRKNVKWISLSRDGKKVLLNKMEEFTGVSMYDTDIQTLRLAAIGLARRLENDLNEWCGYYSSIDEEGALRMEILVPNLPLMVGGMLNLYVVLGDKLQEMRSNLNSLQRSLTVIGKSVDINFLMVEGTGIAVLRAVNLLRMLRNSILINGVAREVDEVEDLLDEGYVYPVYHKSFVQFFDDVIDTLSKNTRSVNDIEKVGMSLKKLWLQEFVSKVLPVQESNSYVFEDGTHVAVLADADILPHKIINIMEKLYECDLIDEAEMLMRVHKMITNADDIAEAQYLKEFFREWKNRDVRLKESIQKAKLENFRNR